MRDAGRTGVAVGFFDGVHVAHRELLSQAAAAFTFRNHPLTVLDPDRAPSLILSAADRLARLSGCGLDEVVAVDFTRDLADTAPEEFAASLLVLAAKFTAAGAPRVLCGPNWRFGRGGVGDAALLRRLGAEVVEVPFVAYRGEAISSTRIREAVERGEMEDAAAMLGRPFEAGGEVFLGKGEGKVEIFRDAGDAPADTQKFVHETKSVKAGEELSFHMASGGGFVIHFKR